MRIRKNAKLSPLFFSSSASPCAAAASSSSISSQGQGGSSVPVVTFQTHVCQLNQSPWDVIPFDSDSIQFQGGDSFTAGNGGGSVGDSIGAVESVASMMEIDDDNHDNYHKVVAGNSCCNGVDEKGWPCKNEPKQGQSFCNHHLSLLRSYNNNNNNTLSTKKAAAAAATATAAAAPPRRGRARAAATGKKTAAAATSSNPSEFYYYSGFGPSWGKRRGDRNNGRGENSAVAESENVIKAVVGGNGNNNAAVQSVEIENNIEDDEFDYDDNDEDEDANDDDSGKKRMRKPVKARSLKSLM